MYPYAHIYVYVFMGHDTRKGILRIGEQTLRELGIREGNGIHNKRAEGDTQQKKGKQLEVSDVGKDEGGEESENEM